MEIDADLKRKEDCTKRLTSITLLCRFKRLLTWSWPLLTQNFQIVFIMQGKSFFFTLY